jgi:uncharacterized protein YidB (DUF937 family)
MARGFPSMTALLGILALAGYQNRDKLAEMLGDTNTARAGSPAGQGSRGTQGGGLAGIGGLLGGSGGGLGGLAGGAGAGGLGGLLAGGLRELTDRFRQNGQSEAVESWVGTGPNRDVAPQELEQAIGDDVLVELSQQTGLPRSEILSRLSRELPKAVDQYTPHGRLPDEDDVQG